MTNLDSQNSTLGRTAVRGASATMLGQVVRIVILLLSTVILARLLVPRDFGLMAIIASVVALGELVRDFGLSTAASREEHLTRGQQSNLFWINTGLGTVLTVIAFLVAPTLAAGFGEPSLVPIMQAISVVFFLGGVSTQFRAELARQLRFGALAVVDTVPVIVGLIAALVYAAWERTFWVLVIQQLATAIAGLVLAVALARWLPGLPDRSASIRQLMSFGIGLFGTQSVAYVTKNVDNVAIGIAWGAGPLGIYSRAYQLLMMPINQISAPMTRVAVPVLTRVAEDTARYVRYLQSGQLLGGVVLGLAYGMCAGLADPLVRVVFGDNWAAMVPVFQVLAVGGIFRALNQITFWMFLAKGKSIAQFKFYLVTQPVIVAAMLAGIPWGPTGVAVGHTVGYFVHWIVSYWWCGKVTDTPTRELFIAGCKQVGIFAVPALIIGLLANLSISSDFVAVSVGIVFLGIYLVILMKLTRYGRGVLKTLIACAKMVRR